MDVIRELAAESTAFNNMQLEFLTFTWFYFDSMKQKSNRAIGVLGIGDDNITLAINSKSFSYWKGNSMKAFLRETRCSNDQKEKALHNFENKSAELFNDHMLFIVMTPSKLRPIWLPKNASDLWPSTEIYDKYKSAYDKLTYQNSR